MTHSTNPAISSTIYEHTLPGPGASCFGYPYSLPVYCLFVLAFPGSVRLPLLIGPSIQCSSSVHRLIAVYVTSETELLAQGRQSTYILRLGLRNLIVVNTIPTELNDYPDLDDMVP